MNENRAIKSSDQLTGYYIDNSIHNICLLGNMFHEYGKSNFSRISEETITSIKAFLPKLPEILETRNPVIFFDAIAKVANIRSDSRLNHHGDADIRDADDIYQMASKIVDTSMPKIRLALKHAAGENRLTWLNDLAEYSQSNPRILKTLEKYIEDIVGAKNPQELQALVALSLAGETSCRRRASAKLRNLIPTNISDLVDTPGDSKSEHDSQQDQLRSIINLVRSSHLIDPSTGISSSRIPFQILNSFFMSVGIDYPSFEKQLSAMPLPLRYLEKIIFSLGRRIDLYRGDAEKYRNLFSLPYYSRVDARGYPGIDNYDDYAYLQLETLGFSLDKAIKILESLKQKYAKHNKKFSPTYDIRSSLSQLSELPKGVAQALYERYQIFDFSRYGTKLLHYLYSHSYDPDLARKITLDQGEILEYTSARYSLELRPLGFTDEESEEIFSWGQNVSGRYEEQCQMLEGNLARAKELDQAIPNASRELYIQFGIRDFARYSLEYHKNLYENKDDTESPWILMVMPQSDYGSTGMAFLDDTDQLFNALPQSHLLRVIEGSSKKDIIERSKRLNFIYNSDSSNSARHLVISGHGSKAERTIAISSSERWDISDFEFGGIGIELLKLLHNRASVLLNACWAGANGLAHKARAASGLKIVAADHSVVVSGFKIAPDIENNNIDYISMTISTTGKLVRLGITQ